MSKLAANIGSMKLSIVQGDDDDGYQILDADGKPIGYLKGLEVIELGDVVLQGVEGEFELPGAKPSSPVASPSLEGLAAGAPRTHAETQ
jgi:hypothetical protein